MEVLQTFRTVNAKIHCLRAAEAGEVNLLGASRGSESSEFHNTKIDVLGDFDKKVFLDEIALYLD